MYIFRWLMKHPIIILVLYFLSIVAILLSMTGGGSPETDAEVANTALEHKTDSTAVDLSDAPAIEPSTLTTALVTGDTSEQSANTEVNQVAATATNGVVKDTTMEGTQETPTEESVKDTATSETVEVVSDEATVSSAKNAESTTLDTGSSEQFSEMNEEELLLMAREAYWNNGLEESAEIYQQLIDLNPELIDYKGELGNVYWRQGFPKKAAELYAAIALPMIEAGDADRVANMVGFIGLFYPDKATEIHNKLQAGK